jgi:hypothetical protein
LPTGATAGSPVATLALADAVNGFALFDLSSSVAGPDTLYALSTVEGLLRKFSTTDGVNWTASGSVATSAANLTGYADGNGVVSLFLTTGSTLSTLVDASGYGGTETGSIVSLATVGANEGFRGIGMWAPIPEPGTFALTGFGLLGLAFFRRSRKV